MLIFQKIELVVANIIFIIAILILFAFFIVIVDLISKTLGLINI
jgi:hypothetical protein